MNTKVCTKCKEELPLNEEYFYKNKRSKDGFTGWCRGCIKIKTKKYWENNREKIIERTKIYEEKRKDIVAEYKKKYYLNHKDELSKYKKEYRAKNKDRISKRDKKYYKENKAKIAIQTREYKKNNKDKYNLMSQRRKAMKKLLPSTLTAEQWEQAKEYFNNRCAYCGRKLKLTQDHFVPIAKGGGLTKENIIPACKSCNCSKQDSDFKDWYPKIKHYSKSREEAILKFLNIED